MLLRSKQAIAEALEQEIISKAAQGFDVGELQKELLLLPDSYDALAAFADKLTDLPLRADWPYVEPNDWDGILAEIDPPDPTPISLEEAQRGVRMAFLSSVCGCILGKPLELDPTYDAMQRAFAPIGEWPIHDYISIEMLERFGDRNGSWFRTARECIENAAADDDLNYTVLGMTLLERCGLDFTKHDLCKEWIYRLPLHYTFGPERLHLMRSAQSQFDGGPLFDPSWADMANPKDECCGAMIRADAYGYAYAGDPFHAAQLAWRDATVTHRYTGVYGAMFAAAAIAEAFVASNPFEIFEVAQRCVPKRSRYYECISHCLALVRNAPDFEAGYRAVHEAYPLHTHCKIYQETGTLINTLAHASDIGEGICLQIMQGNDTDSYGCTCGSILGAYFGEGYLEDRWLAPFHDRIVLGMGAAPEFQLSKLADRMAALPKLTIQA